MMWFSEEGQGLSRRFREPPGRDSKNSFSMSCVSQDRGDRFCPAVSVFEDIWIDLSHTHLADTMTKLNL